MTSLLIKSEQIEIPINLSSLLSVQQMTYAQFCEFCRANPDLRIERSATGEVTIMPFV